VKQRVPQHSRNKSWLVHNELRRVFDFSQKKIRFNPLLQNPSLPPSLPLQQQQWLQSTPAQNATQTSTSTPPTPTHQISTSKPETKTQSPSQPSTPPSSNSKKKIRSVHSLKQSIIGEFRERERRSSVITVIILLVMYMMMVLLLLILLVSFIWVLVKLFLELLGIGLNPKHFESLLKLNSLVYLDFSLLC